RCSRLWLYQGETGATPLLGAVLAYRLRIWHPLPRVGPSGWSGTSRAARKRHRSSCLAAMSSMPS
ncbi:hypothetical protein A2U01_0105980, partial [Trifolium medium]|nr:hypothetical protein [Trifolium medium]